MDTITYTIDAKGKALGRVASLAATYLMAKNLPTFERHKKPAVTVIITNASKLSLTQKKKKDTKYTGYSGYQGGFLQEDLAALSERRGYGEGLKRAIKGMIPDNKLRPDMLKRLKITE